MCLRSAVVSLVLTFSLFAATPSLNRAFNEGQQMSEVDAAQLETAVASNPENMEARARLLGYYAGPQDKDPNWTHRLPQVSWTIANAPDADMLGNSNLWNGLPEPMFQMLKSQWVSQVQQHPDNAMVLRNAASFLTAPKTGRVAIRVGANVAAVNLVNRVEPVYPPLAVQARIQGIVKMNLTIGEDGRVTNATLISGHPLLVGAAVMAVNQWVYKPTLLNGKPVPVTTTADIVFTLPQ